jgi:hypothetical protein
VSARVYVLLGIITGGCNEAAKILRGKPGVIEVELLEGSPEMLFVIESSSRRSLAQLTVSALTSVESLTTGVQLLPTSESFEAQTGKTSSNASKPLSSLAQTEQGGGSNGAFGDNVR